MEENSLFFNWFFFKLPIGTVPEATPIPDEIVGILHSAAPIFSALVGLTLGILADAISMTDKKLSALLNHYLQTSFYDFINAYRVTEVQNKMKDERYDHYTLLAIGLECGFKSKASFNRIFKKVTGLSPSKYKSTFLHQ